jgi:hypothetical protein
MTRNLFVIAFVLGACLMLGSAVEGADPSPSIR